MAARDLPGGADEAIRLGMKRLSHLLALRSMSLSAQTDLPQTAECDRGGAGRRRRTVIIAASLH